MFEVFKGHTGDCQRRTCLKWETSGELSAVDRQNLMQLMFQGDKQDCLGLDEDQHDEQFST